MNHFFMSTYYLMAVKKLEFNLTIVLLVQTSVWFQYLSVDRYISKARNLLNKRLYEDELSHLIQLAVQ